MGAAMIDHISIAVRDIKASARFYEALLAPLGMTPVRASPKTVGFPRCAARARHQGGRCVSRRRDCRRRALRRRTRHAARIFAALLRRLHPRLGRQPHRGGDVFEGCKVAPFTAARPEPPSSFPPRRRAARLRASSAGCPRRDWRRGNLPAMPAARSFALACVPAVRAADPNSR
jgi:catechol 2,3-dioxygenase-like lactoylglutathione lyase family enzyme